jgi:hypothetical protein
METDANAQYATAKRTQESRTFHCNHAPMLSADGFGTALRLVTTSSTMPNALASFADILQVLYNKESDKLVRMNSASRKRPR